MQPMNVYIFISLLFLPAAHDTHAANNLQVGSVLLTVSAGDYDPRSGARAGGVLPYKTNSALAYSVCPAARLRPVPT